MIIRREIGEKGQVVIPKDIREFLGLKEREEVVFEVKGNEVIIRKKEDSREILKDFLNVPRTKRKGSVKEIKKIIEERYDEEIP